MAQVARASRARTLPNGWHATFRSGVEPDFDHRAADVSVDHPRVVENYRSGHDIALRVGKNGASTEDLRAAMIHYRSLFEELVQVPTIVERKEVA